MKYAAALLGVTSAAIGPLPGDSTAFPQYDSQVVASGNDLDGTEIKKTYVSDASANLLGTSKAYRNHLYILPLQTVTKVVTKGATSNCSQGTSGYNSFWVTDKTKVGTYIDPNSGTNDAEYDTGIKHDGSAMWVVCSDISAVVKCNARTYNKLNTADGTLVDIKERWVTYKTVGKANMVSWTDDTMFYGFRFNEDLALAAQYHSGGTIATDGTIWCSAFRSELNVDGTTATESVVTKGYNQATKCNFMYIAGDSLTAPAFKIKETTNNKFLLQYVEFLDKSELGTDGILDTTSQASSFFQGDYATNTGPYLNPWSYFATLTSGVPTAVSNMASTTPAWNNFNNSLNWGAGSVGRARFHTEDAGNMQQYTTMTADISVFWSFQNQKKKEFDDFNAAKTKFEEDKKKFNQALADRDVQLKDFFKMLFDPVVEIPDRPENINRPDAYMGPTIDLSKYVGSSSSTWNVKATDNKGYAALVTGTFDSAPAVNAKFANRIGYLVCSNDIAATTASAVGHLFGRLGQGTDTMPANGAPLYWGATASKVATLLIGMYPVNSDDTGITDATKQTKFEVIGKTWDALTINLPPGQPAETSGAAPAKGGAQYIALGAATALAVASSLY